MRKNSMFGGRFEHLLAEKARLSLCFVLGTSKNPKNSRPCAGRGPISVAGSMASKNGLPAFTGKGQVFRRSLLCSPANQHE